MAKAIKKICAYWQLNAINLCFTPGWQYFRMIPWLTHTTPNSVPFPDLRLLGWFFGPFSLAILWLLYWDCLLEPGGITIRYIIKGNDSQFPESIIGKRSTPPFSCLATNGHNSFANPAQSHAVVERHSYELSFFFFLFFIISLVDAEPWGAMGGNLHRQQEGMWRFAEETRDWGGQILF